MKTAFEVVATRYEQITAKDGLPGAKPMTHKVRIVSESDQFVVGVIVNEEGDEIAPKGFDEKQWLIQKETITKRTPLRMDLDYGILVTATNHSTCQLCGGPSEYLGDPCKCGSDNCYRCTACGDENHD